MTDADMLKMAICFQLDDELFIEKRDEGKWCVVFNGTVVNRDLKRQYEPMPSNRTKEFIEATRFSLEDAFALAKAYKMVSAVAAQEDRKFH